MLLTGGNGFLGSFIYKELIKDFKVIRFGSKEYDIRDYFQAKEIVEKYKPDYIVHAAARLGGIGDNKLNPAHYFYDNIMMGINMLNIASKIKLTKFVNIGTVCSYPKELPVPFKEENLWDGLPEPTNSAYGLSKKSVIDYSIALNKQFGFPCINLLLANLYGINDDFRDETSHVIPAIIKKIDFAIANKKKSISVWGDGTPTRDFLNVKDAARAVKLALISDHMDPFPVNIATGKENTINKVITLIKDKMSFSGSINFDTSKPNGQPVRVLDIKKALSFFNFKANICLENGLNDVIIHFYNKKSKILNMKKKY